MNPKCNSCWCTAISVAANVWDNGCSTTICRGAVVTNASLTCCSVLFDAGWSRRFCGVDVVRLAPLNAPDWLAFLMCYRPFSAPLSMYFLLTHEAKSWCLVIQQLLADAIWRKEGVLKEIDAYNLRDVLLSWPSAALGIGFENGYGSWESVLSTNWKRANISKAMRLLPFTIG